MDDLQDYIEKWIFRADEDIAVIDRLFESDVSAYRSSICFHAQQAVEKYLKALLVFEGIDFRKTHDVDYLLAECQKFAPELLGGIDLKSLTDFGVSVRYPDDFYIPDQTETTHYVRAARKIEQIVKKLIKTDEDVSR